jgi:hypothetical protein
MQKIVLTFGLISGAILSVMMLVTLPFSDAIGFDKGMVIGSRRWFLRFCWCISVFVRTVTTSRAAAFRWVARSGSA